ncbi:ankyrin, partial [Canariomyces notabilis]
MGAGDVIPHDLKQSLVDALYFDKIDDRVTHLTPAAGSTCRWFLSKEEYTTWRDSAKQPDHSGFLWIKGNPGTGKSTLMKMLFEEARKSSVGDPSEIVLSFFFLARGTLKERSTSGLYRSLLHKLFKTSEDLWAGLDLMTADAARGILVNGWHEEALQQTFEHVIRNLGTRSLTIFVDALDECEDDQAKELVDFFEALCDLAQEENIHLLICFSSRHYPHIEIRKGISVTLEDEAGHEEDLKYYVKSKLRLRRSKAAESLQSEILEQSAGTFLWVVLVIDILNSEYPGKRIDKMRERLKEIPQKLADLFELIITRDGENPVLLQLCLQWILFATRPLKPQELYFAVHFGLDKGFSGFWDPQDVDLDEIKTFVRHSSKGLAEVTRNKAAEVQFIHESVRDFLRGRYDAQWFESASGSFEGHGHRVLRDCCLAQLLDISEDQVVALRTTYREHITSQFPFLEYSLNVLRHADSAQQHGVEQRNFLDEFPLVQWIILNNVLEKFSIRRYHESDETASLLYILAERNLAGLIRAYQWKESGFVPVGRNRYRAPIIAALATNGDEAVQALLETEARRQPPDSQLHELCKRYSKKKATPPKLGRDFTYGMSRSVASYIAELGNDILRSFTLPLFLNPRRESIIHLLVQKGAEVNSEDQHGRTPLSYAAERGYSHIVDSLLQRGAQVDLRDNDGRSALSWAAQRRDITREAGTVRPSTEAVVNLLLQWGAQVDSRDKNGRTPLSYAAETGRPHIVDL